MIVRKFQPEDAMAVNDDLMESAWNGILTRETFRSIPGPAWTAIHAGKVIGCGGVILNGDEGVAWGAFSKSMPLTVALDGAIVAKDTLTGIMKSCNLKRLYASARKDFKKSQRYLHFLGFRLGSNQRDESETLMYVKEA